MRISIYKIYLILIFYIAPFIDAFSGYLILSGIISEGGVGSPSQLFRLFLIFISIYIISKNKRLFYFSLFSIFYCILLEYIVFQLHLSFFGFIVGFVYDSKILYLLLIFLTLYYMNTINYISFIKLLKYLNNYILLMSLFLILPFFLGIGFPTYYEGTFGTKGFFSAGNGLGIFMGAGFLLSIYYWQYTREKYSLLKTLIICFSTIIIGTKTVFIITLIGLIFIIYYLNNKYLSRFVFILVISSVTYFYIEIIDILNIIFDVVFKRLSNNESFISFIMSNRDVYFMEAINNISYEGLYILRILFGMGAYISFRNPYEIINGIDTLESDFADIFFMYGIIGLILYFIIIFLLIRSLFIKRLFFLCFIFFLFISHSLVAGHILFNGMSGTLFPILAILTISLKNKEQM